MALKAGLAYCLHAVAGGALGALTLSLLGVSLNISFNPFNGSVNARRIVSNTSAVTYDG
jgi:hypothetical protein